jgi:hypothetical protein
MPVYAKLRRMYLKKGLGGIAQVTTVLASLTGSPAFNPQYCIHLPKKTYYEKAVYMQYR